MKRAITRWLNRDDTVITTTQRSTHTYVIGQSGTGKSRGIEGWSMQDILAGHGVGVLDPHGDLYHNLCARLATRPHLWERVILIDPTDPDWTVSIDPLRAGDSASRQRLAALLTDIVVKIWRIEPSQAPRMMWLLTNCFLALSDLGLTLLDLPRFLLDTSYREGLLPRLRREEVLSYFTLEYPQKDGAARGWAAPVLNKLGRLIFDPDMCLMLAGGNPIDFRAVIDGRNILLVNLSKGILGEGSSALLGAFIVAQIQKAALARSDTRHRPPFYLYLDEFQNYTTDNVSDILSEARKYALSLTLAHQYLEQLEPGIREAVLNTAGTVVCFRVGRRDAEYLVKAIFPASDALRQEAPVVRTIRSGGMPFLDVGTRETATSWDDLAGKLANLPHREFWSRQRMTPAPVHQRTLAMPDVAMTPERRAAVDGLRRASGERWGRPRREAEAAMAGRWSPRTAEGVEPHRDDAVPFWGE